MKKKVKRKIKKQVIFNIFSVLFVLSVGIYFLCRLIYYKLDSEKVVEESTILYERLIEQNDTFELRNSLVHVNGIYRYRGDVDNNYVKYKGFLWRVIKINEDNSVTMITEETVTKLPYGSSLEEHILPWLNQSSENLTGIFEQSLEDSDALKKTRICIDKFSDLEEEGCFTPNDEYKIGLLSVYDYLQADANESYLNNETTFWTSNQSDSLNAWYIGENGFIGTDSVNAKIGIRPVITIDGNQTIQKGNGSVDFPFEIEKEEKNTLQDSHVGEYVTFDNSLWRIVGKEKDSIKIAKEECLKDQNDECLLMMFSKYSNAPMEDEENLLYYLNDTYYNSIQEKDKIVTGKFYSGTYSLMTNDYRTCYKGTTNLKVGFLSIPELFSFEVANTFLMNVSPDNEMSIYSVSEENTLYENMITEQLAIRPSLYLKGTIKIESGDGSYLSPYVLGDE